MAQMGRPKKPKEKKKIITLPVNIELHTKLKESAEKEGRSMLGQIRFILEKYLNMK